MLDVLSIADVTASSVAHYFTQRESAELEDIRVKQGSDEIFRWLAYDGIGIKKATFMLRLNDARMIERATVEFNLVEPSAIKLIPIFI